MPPNVLFIMVDALRADRCWGPERQCQTPFLDELRRRSTIFTNAFSTASTTTICTASLLTGVYPFMHGVHSLARHRLRSDLQTLAEAFKAHGYYTWAEVTGPLAPAIGLDRGFDDYRCRKHKVWLDTPFGESMAARIRENRPRPWLGFLHLWEIHHPRRVTPGYDRPEYGQHLYDRAVSSLDHQLKRLLSPLPEDTLVVLTGDHGEHISKSKGGEFIAGLRRPFARLKKRVPVIKKLRRWAVSALFKTTEATDRFSQRDKDSYWAWLGHGFHVYDPLVHVPLLMYGPGLFPASAELPHLVSHVDIFPTLASALGFQLPSRSAANGIDLMPLVGDPGAQTIGRAIYMEVADVRTTAQPELWLAGLRTERFKFVRGLLNESLPEELYDLEQDPTERENVVNRYPEVVAGMRARLRDLMQSSPIHHAETEIEYSSEELTEVQERLRDLGYVD